MDHPTPEHSADYVADRTVHAQSGEEFLVRYDRAGAWYVEYEPNRYRPCRRVKIQEAVDLAIDMQREGGTIYLGRPGGNRFDYLVKRHPLHNDGTDHER